MASRAEARDAGAQARADAARERDELREALNARAQILEESRTELRQRAERAEQDLAAARAGLAAGPGTSRPGARRGRTAQQPGDQAESS